jgi:hypothetical protein
MVTDNVGTNVFISGLIVTGLPILGATFVVVNNECFNSFSGEISMTINGGQLPYTIETTGPDNYSTSVANLKLLVNGSYVTTITDSLNNSVQYTNTNINW